MMIDRNILVLDDDPDMGSFVSFVANGLGLLCTSTTTSYEFLSELKHETALILLDVMMPDVDGVQVLRLLAQQECKTNIVLMSGISNRLMEAADVLAKALGLSVVGRLQKPFRLSALETLLKEFAEPPGPSACPSKAALLITDAELQAAIDENQFLLNFQPQIDLASNQVVGFEALVRWQHPRKGLILPDSFIPRLEGLDLTDRLGMIVTRLGISELRRFHAAYGNSHTLSLNVSACSLLDLELPETLLALAHANGILPNHLTVEVTESALLDNLSRSLDVLIRLRINGFQVSIDDFGTGYAMMEQLRYIPATEIKIDLSFVQNMNLSSSDRVVVEKTVEIGHELGMKVVAEGVETEAQLKFLKSIHCDLGQGYFFSRPLHPLRLTDWMGDFQQRNENRGESVEVLGIQGK